MNEDVEARYYGRCGDEEAEQEEQREEKFARSWYEGYGVDEGGHVGCKSEDQCSDGVIAVGGALCYTNVRQT